MTGEENWHNCDYSIAAKQPSPNNQFRSYKEKRQEGLLVGWKIECADWIAIFNLFKKPNEE